MTRGGENIDPGVKICTTLVEVHKKIQTQNIKALGLMVSNKDFLIFPYINLCKIVTPPGGTNINIGNVSRGLLDDGTYYLSPRSYGF